MSTKHLLEVTCDRCGEADIIDPTVHLVARNKPFHDNYHVHGEPLHKAAAVRPPKWGKAEARLFGGGGSDADLCPLCFDFLKAALAPFPKKAEETTP